jgi:hypothetical protein
MLTQLDAFALIRHHYNFSRNATLYIFARIHPGKLRWNQPVVTFILRTC